MSIGEWLRAFQVEQTALQGLAAGLPVEQVQEAVDKAVAENA
jgi:hypothetical protein